MRGSGWRSTTNGWRALLRAEIERLAEIRRRVVATADAERRAIERNLHDGAQQQLVALALEIGLAAVDAESDEHGTAADGDR